MSRRHRPSASERLCASTAPAIEALENRVLLSTYMVTNNLDAGPGSLRADIQMANASAGADTITFAPGLTGPITLTSGQLEISDDLTITGPGAGSLTISGNNKSRVFQIDAGVNASISGLTITGGHAADGVQGAPAHFDTKGNFVPGGPGGAGADGGGIYNLGSLAVSSAVVTNNSAGTGGEGGATFFTGGSGGGAGAAGGNGGGIYSKGSLTVIDSTIVYNAAGAAGNSVSDNTFAANGGSGGGIYAADKLVVIGSTVDSNSAAKGGYPGGHAPETTPGGNGGNGGGILAFGPTTLTASTISNNRAGNGTGIFGSPSGAGGSGGGIFASAELTIANCTVSGNAVGNGPPGGGTGGGVDALGPLRLTNCTVSRNNAVYVLYQIYGTGSVILNNTIVDSIHGTLDPSSSHNFIGYDAMLAPLGSYGGPTQTMPPLPGSPVIDAGDNSVAVDPDGMPLVTDQRGQPRIVDATHTGTATVDIGAVEIAPLPTSPLVVSTTADELDPNYSSSHLSFREAVDVSNSLHGSQTITFAAGLSGAINLSGQMFQLEVKNTTGAITIQGPGQSVLSLGGNPMAMDRGATVGIVGLTLAGIQNNGDVTLTNSTANSTTNAGTMTLVSCLVTGFGVQNSGLLVVNNCKISGNQGSSGGGVNNLGTARFADCTISNNSALYGSAGGGILNGAGGALTLVHCVITSNSAGSGGGIENHGTLTMSECTVSGNAATVNGGGIRNAGTLVLLDSTISGNTSGSGGMAAGGGGLFADTGGTLTLANCTISGNEAKQGDGGGIANGGTLTLTNCTVSDNTSFVGNGGGLALSAGDASIYNTIVALNHNLARPDIAGNLDYNYSTNKTQYTRSAPSSNNLISDGSGNLPFGQDGNPADGNLLGTSLTLLDPRLAPLGNYGGPAQTMALRTGSPAIDAGSNALALGPDGKPLTTDQRGYYRIFNGAVDIGAYEYGSSALLPGDADGDGKVGFSDLLIVARHYGSTNATWADGDFNGDGSVGFDDLVIVARNYGKSISLTSTAAAMLSASQFSGAATASIADSPAAVVKHHHTR